MTTAIRDEPMAKKARRGDKETPTVAVKIDRAIASKARMIATDRGLNLAEYVSEALRGVVEKDWAKMVRRVGGEEEA